jgi:hypothetical protein
VKSQYLSSNMNFIKSFIASVILLLSTIGAWAQNGYSGNSGVYINYNDYLNTTRTYGGDFDIAAAGVFEIDSAGVCEVIGAVHNMGIILLDSGAVLSIFGDMNNEGKIVVKVGATINFYGQVWTNSTSAQVIDGGTINATPGGQLIANSERPDVTIPWLKASGYLVNYSGETHQQYLDGGNIPMDVVFHVHNPLDVTLINSATRIEGILHMGERNSQVILGDNDLIITQNGSIQNCNAESYMVTNGNGHLTKENFVGKFLFPIGKDTESYTPTAIENIYSNTMHVLVQDYATSAATESTPQTIADGVDRTWNIYADHQFGLSNITLQHNEATSQSAYNVYASYVTRWLDKATNTTGDHFSTTSWQSNNAASETTGDLSSLGAVAGSWMRSRTYDHFATSATDPIAFYTKSSEAFKLQTVNLISLKADSNNCEAIISFQSGRELNIKSYQLQTSIDGVTYNTLTSFEPKGDSALYSYVHMNPASGKNYYRVLMVEANGDYTISNIATTTIDCKTNTPAVVLYPNPSREKITIDGLEGNSKIRIVNTMGRVMLEMSTLNKSETIDISMLPPAHYFTQVITGKLIKVNLKFLKL